MGGVGMSANGRRGLGSSLRSLEKVRLVTLVLEGCPYTDYRALLFCVQKNALLLRKPRRTSLHC